MKGVRRLGVKLGNWLTAEQDKNLLESPQGNTLPSKRDRAVLAVLLGCGLRWAEAIGLALETIQLREGHWAIADLIGKGGRVRTVPVPNWVKTAIDSWTTAAQIKEGRIFRSINRGGRVWG